MAQSGDRIVRGLRAAGVQVDVAHLTRSTRPPTVERGEGGYRITAPLGDDPEHALRRLWTDIDRVRRLAPDGRTPAQHSHVVAFGGATTLLAAPTYAAWLGVPLLTLLRGNDFDTGVFSMRRRPVLLDALRASRAVATVASSFVPQVEALVPGVEVRWITNGIDPAGWQALPSDIDRARRWRAAHVEPDRVLIGVVGQLKAKKGVALLLDAVRRSRAADRVHLLLVGDADPGLLDPGPDPGPHLTHVPFLDRFELLHYYPACDLVALPSFYDGLPNVALEAGSLGLPLLCSDAGGLADLVADGDGGWVFAAGDAPACRAALDRALSATPDERRAQGATLRTRVADRHSATAEAAAYVRLLADTAPGGTPGP